MTTATNETEQKARVIKRYQNRKLYDTEASCYVTLEEVAKLHKQENVVVIENKSKSDITTETLFQAIVEDAKKKMKDEDYKEQMRERVDKVLRSENGNLLEA